MIIILANRKRLDFFSYLCIESELTQIAKTKSILILKADLKNEILKIKKLALNATFDLIAHPKWNGKNDIINFKYILFFFFCFILTHLFN